MSGDSTPQASELGQGHRVGGAGQGWAMTPCQGYSLRVGQSLWPSPCSATGGWSALGQGSNPSSPFSWLIDFWPVLDPPALFLHTQGRGAHAGSRVWASIKGQGARSPSSASPHSPGSPGQAHG